MNTLWHIVDLIGHSRIFHILIWGFNLGYWTHFIYGKTFRKWHNEKIKRELSKVEHELDIVLERMEKYLDEGTAEYLYPYDPRNPGTTYDNPLTYELRATAAGKHIEKKIASDCKRYIECWHQQIKLSQQLK